MSAIIVEAKSGASSELVFLDMMGRDSMHKYSGIVIRRALSIPRRNLLEVCICQVATKRRLHFSHWATVQLKSLNLMPCSSLLVTLAMHGN
jgi:hypothetical protein